MWEKRARDSLTKSNHPKTLSLYPHTYLLSSSTWGPSVQLTAMRSRQGSGLELTEGSRGWFRDGSYYYIPLPAKTDWSMQTVHISCPPRRGPALKLVWVSPYSNTIHAYHANWRAQHDNKTISLLIHLLHNGGPTNGLYTQSLPRCGPDMRSGLGYVV